jgi:hypothetical protein
MDCLIPIITRWLDYHWVYDHGDLFMKTCTKCKKTKSLEFFGNDKSKTNGKKSHCKECCSEAHKKWAMTENGREISRNLDKKRREKIRQDVNFVKKKIEAEEHKKWLLTEEGRQFYINNKRQKTREAMRKYRSTEIGLGKTRESSRKSKINSTKTYESLLRHRETVRKWQSEKIKSDPLFKLSRNLRSLIKNSMKKLNYKKSSKTEKILGCDFEFFQLYMELQFKPGMRWDNHAEWHIDHKTPISWAKTEEEVIKLNHFTNLQPLWAVENIKKGNRYAS